MGQKVNPTGIRLGIVKDHASVWYAERGAYADKLNNDLEVRSFLEERLKNASVSRIHIERPANNARITIHTARPGIVIGKKRRRCRPSASRSDRDDGCSGSCEHRRSS